MTNAAAIYTRVAQPVDTRPAQADSDLIQFIYSRGLNQDGNSQLRQHVLSTALNMAGKEDSRARFVKVRPNGRIDAAVALSMASAQAMYLSLSASAGTGVRAVRCLSL